MEIIIVDNHSEDESIGTIRNRFSSNAHIRIIESPKNVGYGQGNALGEKFARGRYILIINPDNELESGGLEKMIAAMEADPTIGILSPQLIQSDGTIRDSVRRFPTIADVCIKRTVLRHFFRRRVENYLQKNENPSAVRRVDWAVGACLLMKKSLYEDLGGFDPQFFLFFEDIDFCRRVAAVGKRVLYYPLVKATDRKHRLSEGGFFTLFTKRTVRIHLASALKYFWKWRNEKVPT